MHVNLRYPPNPNVDIFRLLDLRANAPIMAETLASLETNCLKPAVPMAPATEFELKEAVHAFGLEFDDSGTLSELAGGEPLAH